MQARNLGLLALALITTVAFGIWLGRDNPGPLAMGLLIAAMAFAAEYVDSSIGMGYGTTLSPVLLLIGYPASDVVPALLCSELITGLLAGICHHREGNADFGPGSRARGVAMALGAISAVGVLTAVVVAVKLPEWFMNLYIGLMLMGVALFLIFGRRSPDGFSWKRIGLLGGIAAFNKGISGGGYGPLLTGGQILAGVNEKESIAITSVAESFVCALGLALYLALRGAPTLNLVVPLTAGAVLSVPLAAWTVRRMPPAALGRVIAAGTLALGVLCLFRI